MNNTSGPEPHRSLQILTELSSDDSLTQRDLSSRLGIALGLVNSYIRNLAAKGYITVKSIPPRRYTYFLTPKGFAEKRLFSELHSEGVKRVVFAGADEVAEIAFLTLQETGIELCCIVDEEMAGKKFLGRDILPLSAVSGGGFGNDCIVVTSYLKRETIYGKLLDGKRLKKDIKVVFPVADVSSE